MNNYEKLESSTKASYFFFVKIYEIFTENLFQKLRWEITELQGVIYFRLLTWRSFFLVCWELKRCSAYPRFSTDKFCQTLRHGCINDRLKATTRAYYAIDNGCASFRPTKYWEGDTSIATWTAVGGNRPVINLLYLCWDPLGSSSNFLIQFLLRFKVKFRRKFAIFRSLWKISKNPTDYSVS